MNSQGSDHVVVVSGARTAIGSNQGSLASIPAHELGATAVKAAMERAGIDAREVDEVIMGCIGQVGPDAFNARRVALAAGLPVASTAYNVNRLCGSGLQAIVNGAMALQLGHSDVVVAGGNESMSRQPYLAYQERDGNRLGDRVLTDGTLSLVTDPWGNYPMGATAEIVAERYGVTREEQDAWALQSQQRVATAVDAGYFLSEIVPVEVAQRNADPISVVLDQHPRPQTTIEMLAKLKPSFKAGGTVTAGNSSGINDAGAATVLMRESDALARNQAPLGRLVGWSVAGVDPEVMGYAPVFAIQKVLTQLGLTLADIDVVELNEAFAAQVVAVVRDAKLDPERTNPNGGAIALGHPVGATGAILTVKMLHDMQRRGLKRGLVTMCIGGGQAMAAVFESLS